jgi:hypothetical protein
VARERRVVTPDGYVWYLRRHRARRRPPWSRRDRRRSERFHGEEELTEKLPGPPLTALFTEWAGSFDDAVNTALLAVLAVLAVGAVLAWLLVGHVLPRLVPLVADNARPLLAAGAVLAALAALNQVQRPWYVELRRQGLADAPRRVWRVRGWRRSGRLMDQLTAAIRDGRIDNRRAVVLLPDRR